MSPDGNVFSFVITSVYDLRLKLNSLEWCQGREPDDVGIKIDVAIGTATRWTQVTFGDP